MPFSADPNSVGVTTEVPAHGNFQGGEHICQFNRLLTGDEYFQLTGKKDVTEEAAGSESGAAEPSAGARTPAAGGTQTA